MLEASAFQALQAQAPYRGIIKPPVELVVHDLAWQVVSEIWKERMGSGKIQQILLQGKRPARGIFCFINRFNVDGVSSVSASASVPGS